MARISTQYVRTEFSDEVDAKNYLKMCSKCCCKEMVQVLDCNSIIKLLHIKHCVLRKTGNLSSSSDKRQS